MPVLPLITSKVKDDTLRWLCHNVRPGRMIEVDFPDLLQTVAVDFDTIVVVLEDFQDTGLIESLTTSNHQAILLVLKLKAHDLLQRGGFAVIDALNEANIQKILLEVENLRKQLKSEQPEQIEAINKITSIASSLATVLAAFSDRS